MVCGGSRSLLMENEGVWVPFIPNGTSVGLGALKQILPSRNKPGMALVFSLLALYT